ncbi:ABC-F family ATP-binding cassette domain-containing protein [Mumia sp. zg.B17]|uniref:ABC-F family ATP-binding cassette domain-containing protein n=1 Tax=unclassified Mumia TaxID=2621872 RepID=UPI001C6F0A8E|nr:MULTISPECIES: ABC-F family ATP-binding cassette domain-containing protein [unclassified Mumia]MBW9206929.1 ABC-F family ATP-binding cassette domain-containing protein [Mumia sp. zg.B17]MBW9210737.1 ABC-F family ATP-binding cassette domain-containing protein [Mumia sp. zg.B21]MDD9348906.1 ABC-F family ATP-binding cassette domain-containing protein [Mumia sp.]
MTPPPNLVNLDGVDKSHGTRTLLDSVSLGIAATDRIGVVGRNGGGKTTLLRVLSRIEPPDAGRVTHTRGLEVGFLNQRDDLHEAHTLREAVLGGKADHEWAADATTREIVTVLLAGIPLDRIVEGMSGGERRRASLARLLLGQHDLLVLDEPTNHLDIDAIAWLARHVRRRECALVVVTHDRWFLDEVATRTWEVHDGVVDQYDGGYAAYVLARAERDRQAAATESRRRNLVRKELAWLRRGPPARTSKPKFRIEAANTLIADEPPPRDRLELERFATQRLGKDVFDLEDVSLVRGDALILDRATWRLGPGDRVGLVGPNGTGKTSIMRLLTGEVAPDSGRVKRGKTVTVAYLSQALDEMDPTQRVLDAVKGPELQSSTLLEGFGFTGDLLTARIGDLSGGERRRLQVMRILQAEPNVLLLDEPTNDLDIDTLTVIEDYLDRWPGTLVAVSHDRYFLERVTDTVFELPGDGSIRMLVGGVEEYHPGAPGARRTSGADAAASVSAGAPSTSPQAGMSGAEERAAHKEMARIDRRLARLSEQASAVENEMAANATDVGRLTELQKRLSEIAGEREELESIWLQLAEMLD